MDEQLRAFTERMQNTAPAANSNSGIAGQQRQGQLPQTQQPGMLQGYGNPPGGGGGMTMGMQAGAFGGPQNLLAAGLNPYAAANPGITPYAQHPGQGTPSQVQQPPQGPTNALATNQQLQQLAAQHQGQPMQQQPQLPGYVGLPGNYGPPGQQQPPPQFMGSTTAYQVGYQYSSPGGQPNGQLGSPNVPPNYTGPYPIPDVPQYTMPSQAHASVPVLLEPDIRIVLCHVCNICGRRRSSGFHRKHPVIPGRPPLEATCRKCKIRAHREREKRARARELREDNQITIKVEHDYGRGRDRGRSEVRYVRRHSSSSPRRTKARQGSRAADLGPHVLLDNDRRGTRRSTEVRYASSSPPLAMRGRLRRSDDGFFPPAQPPPAHRPRYVEVSPSPPPTRRSVIREVYREVSVEPRPIVEYRPRSSSPVRVFQRDRRSEEAEARIASHPAAFRTVPPDHRSYLRESEASISTDSPTRRLSPRRGILRHSGMDYETTQRRQMQESYDSMLPEVGHSKVQFAAEPTQREERREPDTDRFPRKKYTDGHISSGDDHRYRYELQRQNTKHVPPPPPSPPIQGFNNLHLRPASPPSSRVYDRETRIRHVSPNGRYVEARTRYVSPSRGRATRARELSPDLSEYRTVTCPRQDPSLEPDLGEEDWEDGTDSDIEEDEPRPTNVRVARYTETDENGQPIWHVEERRTPMLPNASADEPKRYPSGHAMNYQVG